MNRRIVCNTGPIIALSVIDRIEILRNLFETVIVSEQVHKEVLRGGSEYAGLKNYGKADWIRVQSILNPMEPLLATLLDEGEASVIELSRELNSEFVLIDELKGRKIARIVYGLKVIGSARVLVEAKKRGLLADVGRELRAMREAGYWISDKIVAEALRQAGEM